MTHTSTNKKQNLKSGMFILTDVERVFDNIQHFNFKLKILKSQQNCKKKKGTFLIKTKIPYKRSSI